MPAVYDPDQGRYVAVDDRTANEISEETARISGGGNTARVLPPGQELLFCQPDAQEVRR